MNLKLKIIIVLFVIVFLPGCFMFFSAYNACPSSLERIWNWYNIPIVIVMVAVMIYGSNKIIFAPIKKLREATHNIKNGNLDFRIGKTSKDEIGQLFQDFEEMRMRLKESAEEKIVYDHENKELISNISHDLKTPIMAIKGYAEGLLDGVADTSEKMEHYLQTIYNKANEMDRLINELSLYSQIDTNQIPYNFTSLSATGFFGDCAEELFLDLEAKGMEFIYKNELSDDCEVIVDPEQIRRVINNVANNAVKYNDKEHGTLRMTLKDAGNFIQVEMADNGKGILKHDLPYIFNRFYRTDTSRSSSSGGSGIGLSIVKKIIEEHGGNIWATSEDGKETTMHFVIRKTSGGVS